MLAGVRVLVVVWLLVSTTPALAAGLFRAYVSSAGSDGNDCTLPHPCRLLPRALSAVASGGEIWMLDSANYNTSQVDVDRSVTILAVPGALGSVVATNGGDAIFVGTAGIKVTLRNLVIVRLGTGNDGIGVNQASELDVEDCEISNMTSSGIAAYDAAAKVRVTSTRLRGNNNGVYARGPVVVSLDRATVVGNATAGAYADAGSKLIVSGSILRDNGNGVYAIDSQVSLQGSQSDSNTTAGLYADNGSHVLARDSNFAANGSYGVIANSTTGNTQVALVHDTASGSPYGYRVAALPTGIANIWADGNQCFNCGFMFTLANGGGTEGISTQGNNGALWPGFGSNGPLAPWPFL
ncbi:MAG TPA: right-handed parallel beta-helix repeat-containing protein [Casimicrobiaceae bacterium]|jgi:hypothetical protein|nr:right-handed parallel beta-helix repeat-containing protein [Casimicrobiaceae bacterium]